MVVGRWWLRHPVDRNKTNHFLVSSVGGVSPDSPLGSALMGKGVGDVVAVEAPRGAWHATVRSIRRA